MHIPLSCLSLQKLEFFHCLKKMHINTISSNVLFNTKLLLMCIDPKLIMILPIKLSLLSLTTVRITKKKLKFDTIE